MSLGAAEIRALQRLTIAWMSVELTVGLVAGIRASSIALTSFAGDSAVELISACVVLLRFRLGPHVEKRAAITNAVLLYVLAGYIVLMAIFSLAGDGVRPRPSPLGIVLLLTAALVMPLLGAAKKRLAVKTGSNALRADAAQSNLCGYMSWIALAGLALNAVFHLPWVDPLAALILLPIVLREANEARRGEVCCC